MVVSTVTKLLPSLLHACFVVGRRMLAHKCGGHLISILTRSLCLSVCLCVCLSVCLCAKLVTDRSTISDKINAKR